MENSAANLIVNWAGVSAPDELPPGDLILNRPEAVQLARSPTVRRSLMRLAGVALARRGRAPTCRAHVFNCRVVALFAVRAGRTGRRLRLQAYDGKLLEKVIDMAVRAISSCRLDFGVVDLLVRGGSAYVVNLRPDLPEGIRTMRRLRRSLHTAGTVTSPPERDFLLGADPEFMVVNRRTRRLVVASRYLPRFGSVGVDSQRMRGTRRARPIIEVRPRPTSDPFLLVDRIKRLLARVPVGMRRRGMAWCAGSGPRGAYPIGGHIHFSGIPLTAGLLRALDTYVALPVLLLENPIRARRRRRQYGQLSTFRQKRWGFEYRTLPSWLVSPEYARAIICLSRLAAKYWPWLRYDPFLEPDLVRGFYRCNKELLYEHFERAWADLQQLPEFAEYEEALAPLAEAIRQRAVWREELDFRRSWGIR